MLAGLEPLVTPSLAGLLTLVILLILTGRLVPLGTHTREIAAANRRADDYKAAGEADRARADKLADSLSEMLPYMKTANAIIEELRRTAAQGPP